MRKGEVGDEVPEVQRNCGRSITSRRTRVKCGLQPSQHVSSDRDDRCEACIGKMRANASSLRLTYHTCPFRSPLSQGGGRSDRRTRSSNTWQDVLRSSRTLKRIPRCRLWRRGYNDIIARDDTSTLLVDPITIRYS